MGFLLCSIALLLLISAGCGIFFLITPCNRLVSNIELLSLAILYGITFVTLCFFACGWLTSGWPLRLTVSILCLIVVGAGLYRKKDTNIHIIHNYPRSIGSYIIIVLLIIQLGIIAWVSLRTPLGWDGLFNWEIKARIAFENNGSIPPSYFSAQSLWWSHRGYPLLVPLLEAWFYSWLGVPHQGVSKIVQLLFYIAAIGLLAAGDGKIRKIPAVLLFFVPLTWFGDGSITTGYADFPLAVYYLASVVYLAEYWELSKPSVLKLFAISSMSLLWIKQEGLVLWLILCGLVIIRTIWLSEAKQRKLISIFIVIFPGATLLIFWTLLMQVFGVQTRHEYLPLTLGTLITNLGRLPSIFSSFLNELITWKHWGLLWVMLVVSTYFLRYNTLKHRYIIYLCTIILPIPAYLSAYLFLSTANASIEALLSASLSRNLLHVSLIVILFIGGTIVPNVDKSMRSS